MEKSDLCFKLSDCTEADFRIMSKRITYLRESILHMTQQEFSTALNISQTYLSLIENSKNKINEQLLLKLIERFHINPFWLISLDGPDENAFSSANISKEYLKQAAVKTSLSELQKNYQLKPKEVDFFVWLLSLPKNKRLEYISSFNSFVSLIKDYPPEES